MFERAKTSKVVKDARFVVTCKKKPARDSNPLTLQTVMVVQEKNFVVYKVQYNFLMLSRSTNILEEHGSIRSFI